MSTAGAKNVMKVMIFIDFWNYELNMKSCDPSFKTDWFKLPQVIVQQAQAKLGQVVQYDRCFIMGSYDNNSPKELGLERWARTFLANVPGVVVDFSPRQRRNKGPSCTGTAHHEVRDCPVCGASMLGTQEKGVDTKIATEMLTMAFANKCDAIVLVSADKDFIPAAERVVNHGVKVLSAFFPNRGNALAGKCWASFDLFKEKENFRR